MDSTNEILGSGRSAAATRWTVWGILLVSAVVALATLVLGIGSIVTDAVAGRTPMTLVASGSLPSEADAGPATIVSGGYETATVVLEGVSTGTVALASAAGVIGVLTQTAVAASIAFLGWRLLRARPFLPALTNAITFAGAALLIGSLLSSFLGGFAAWEVSEELNASGDDGFWPMAFTVDPFPMAMGAAFLLVALAFGYGDKLSRDTEGLV